MELPDVQSSLPEVRINLTRVGVKNVQKLVEVARPGKRPVIFISNFDVFVDLPGSLKGANLSRNFEVIDEVLQQAIDGEVKVIEALQHGSAETPRSSRVRGTDRDPDAKPVHGSAGDAGQ